MEKKSGLSRHPKCDIFDPLKVHSFEPNIRLISLMSNTKPWYCNCTTEEISGDRTKYCYKISHLIEISHEWINQTVIDT